MSQLVVLNLAQGNLTEGCPTVIAQLWQADRPTAMQVLGSLPPAPELDDLYGRWRQLYQALYAYKGWRWRSPLIEIDEDEDISHISEPEFDDLCHQIQSYLNAWLNTPQFRLIDRQLRTHLVPTDEIRFVISATDRTLLRLPWRLWQFFQDYSRSELALSLPDFTHSVKVTAPRKEKINILAILGDRQGINIDQDKVFLEQLPDTKLTFLVEPNIKQLSEQLWEQN